MRYLENRNTRIALGLLAVLIVIAVAFNPDRTADGLMRWMTIVNAGVAGWIVGWLSSPKAKRLRRLVLRGAVIGIAVFIFIAPPVMGWSLTYLIASAAFIAVLCFWFGGALRNGLRKPTTFGSAEWATFAHLDSNGVIGDDGIRLGTFDMPDHPSPLQYTGDRHLLTIAPTRSGKGTTAIIPNLLTYQGSALVIDPKGENAMITAAQRTAMGQTIHIVDPWLTTGLPIARFNPLDWLVPGDPEITENAMLIADALVVTNGERDPFWAEEAKALLQGIILYVATEERERGVRDLARVRDLLLLDGDDLRRLFDRMAMSLYHVVASTGSRCLQKDEKLLASVLASAQAQTHFLDSHRIRESLSASDFKFEDLKADRITIYLVLPADRLDTFGRWLRLLIQQSITVNARNIAHKPAKPVLFLLDEMAALGRLAAVEQAYSLMAGFGMQLWGIVQDASQLRRIYGESWETFVANSGVISYYGSRDRMSAEYFSALCGMTTVWNIGTAISTIMGASGSTTHSQNTSSVQRPLAFADELMRIRRTEQLILIDNLNPIKAARQPWFENPQYQQLGRNLHKWTAQ